MAKQTAAKEAKVLRGPQREAASVSSQEHQPDGCCKGDPGCCLLFFENVTFIDYRKAKALLEPDSLSSGQGIA
jgi:hypothetical protein